MDGKNYSILIRCLKSSNNDCRSVKILSKAIFKFICDTNTNYSIRYKVVLYCNRKHSFGRTNRWGATPLSNGFRKRGRRGSPTSRYFAFAVQLSKKVSNADTSRNPWRYVFTVLACSIATFNPWKQGKYLVWDVTCISTIARSHVTNAASQPGLPAITAERKKKEKYSCLDNDKTCPRPRCPRDIESQWARGQQIHLRDWPAPPLGDRWHQVSVFPVAENKQGNTTRQSHVCLGNLPRDGKISKISYIPLVYELNSYLPILSFNFSLSFLSSAFTPFIVFTIRFTYTRCER